MKNFTHLLFLLALLVGSNSSFAQTRVVPQAGKYYRIKAYGNYSKNNRPTPFTWYLSAEEGSQAIKATTTYETDARGNTASNFIWYVGKDEEANPSAPYYLMNHAYGVVGRGWGYKYDTSTGELTDELVQNIPVVSGNYEERFYIIDFPATFSTPSATGSEVTGVNITFVNDATSSNPNRTISIAQDNGEINWFDHSTMAQAIGNRYWTTNFIFEEVTPYEPQKHTITFTRTDDDAAIDKEEGDPSETDWKHNVDYNYYATLTLPYPVKLPVDIDGIYGINDDDPALMSENKVNLIDLTTTANFAEETDAEGTHKVLPALSSVLLMITGENHDSRGVTITRTLEEADTQSRNPLTTGFHGTTTALTSPALHDNTCDETWYILGKVNGRVSFYYLNDYTIAPNKAYFVYDNSGRNAANALNIVFNAGDATAIDKVENAPVAGSNAPIYDLTGRRVAAPVKGNLYIQGGRKFIQK